ncbi:MAG: 30S ribosomal protein S6 [Ignavibacteriales bacterium]|nr:MAG: 30S ribosomal protein S6 [Ignavibacteriales bacterium]
MRIHQYESTIIVNAALEDDQIEALVTKVKDFIENHGGTIVDLDRWGRKRLAYQINKSKIGYYAVYRFSAPTELISQLERLYRLDEQIIRFLTVKLDKFAIAYLDEAQTRRAQDAAAAVSQADAVAEPETAVEEVSAPEASAEEKPSAE